MMLQELRELKLPEHYEASVTTLVHEPDMFKVTVRHMAHYPFAFKGKSVLVTSNMCELSDTTLQQVVDQLVKEIGDGTAET
jgi:hypothetical protein